MLPEITPKHRDYQDRKITISYIHTVQIVTNDVFNDVDLN